jgi:IS4 transposase
VPERMEVSGAGSSGKNNERHHLRQRLEADHCYVLDRWYAEFALWNEIVAHRSSYVCRIKDNSNLDCVLEERPVSADAQQAGVLQDLVLKMGRGKLPNHSVRVVMVKTTPHKKRGRAAGGTTGPTSDGILRIATNLLDVPAEVIADIYRHRWTIELFFRFFKHMLGCRHLLSTDPVGIQIQAYLAIIACLLIHLWTGGKPTLRTYEMVCFYLQGWADEDELLEHVKKLAQTR